MFRKLFALLLFASSLEHQAQSICQIQGNGATSPFAGQQVSTEGVVTALFTGPGSLNGYFLEQADCDSDFSTSNGVFVYDSTPTGVAVGQRLSVTATVTEFNGVTELTDPSVQVLGSASHTPTEIELPVASLGQWERYEGMLLRFPATLTVIDNTGWVQYGEVHLATGRLFTPSEHVDPNDAVASGTTIFGQANASAVAAQEDLNTRSQVLLDDGRTASYPNPLPWADANNTLRTGSTITGLTAVLHYAYGEYRLEPVGGIPIQTAPRPLMPVVDGDMRAASLNVLNYFTTLGDWGAQNAGELTRQRTKLVSAIQAMNADVLALCEVENTDAAWNDLLAGVNSVMGANTYDALEENGFGNGTRTVIFYKPATLIPITPLYWIGTNIFQRPHLTQGFERVDGGGRFLFSTIHLRSKLCDNATGANLDQDDGQGCFNDNRRAQANALVTHWEELRNTTGIPAQLVMGDFNAYSEEDPIDVLRASGLNEITGSDEYSYVYRGNSGSLDHAFGTLEMVDALSGAAVWHINSDEPPALDYSDANLSRFQPNAYRCSDHDPVLVGFNGSQLPVVVEREREEQKTNFSIQARRASWHVAPPFAQGAEVYIFDTRGALVQTQGQSTVGSIINADLKDLASGVYMWHIVNPNDGVWVASGRFALL